MLCKSTASPAPIQLGLYLYRNKTQPKTRIVSVAQSTSDIQRRTACRRLCGTQSGQCIVNREREHKGQGSQGRGQKWLAGNSLCQVTAKPRIQNRLNAPNPARTKKQEEKKNFQIKYSQVLLFVHMHGVLYSGVVPLLPLNTFQPINIYELQANMYVPPRIIVIPCWESKSVWRLSRVWLLVGPGSGCGNKKKWVRRNNGRREQRRGSH